MVARDWLREMSELEMVRVLSVVEPPAIWKPSVFSVRVRPLMEVKVGVLVEESTPEETVTTPSVVKEEKVIVPEEVIPVAEAMAPEELTWNWEEEPTERRLKGSEVPMPTLPK